MINNDDTLGGVYKKKKKVIITEKRLPDHRIIYITRKKLDISNCTGLINACSRTAVFNSPKSNIVSRIVSFFNELLNCDIYNYRNGVIKIYAFYFYYYYFFGKRYARWTSSHLI